MFFFFFFKIRGVYSCSFFFSSRSRHTRCGRDWSSDVCSSDLVAGNNKANTCTPGGDVCNVPAGSGIAVVAADTNRVDHNQVHGNNSLGIIVASLCNAFHLSPALCASLGIDPNPDGNHIVFNKVTGNGAAPDPGIAPLPGGDLLWDGTGSGNCWANNTAVSTFPAQLPGCR